MDILYTILIGFVIGLVARFLKPGDDKMGIIATTLVGVGGSFLAPMAAAPWVCMAPTRSLASSPAWWARSSCW